MQARAVLLLLQAQKIDDMCCVQVETLSEARRPEATIGAADYVPVLHQEQRLCSSR